MNGFPSTCEQEICADIQARFAAIFEIKSTGLEAQSASRPLDLDEQGLAWNALLLAVPAVLAHCPGITPQSGHIEILHTLVLWDFLNGREISLGVNNRGGYDLSIKAEKVSWIETQLPLDLLLLKLLALDYTPEDFRAIVG